MVNGLVNCVDCGSRVYASDSYPVLEKGVRLPPVSRIHRDHRCCNCHEDFVRREVRIGVYKEHQEFVTVR